MATDINDQGIAGGAGVVSIDTGPPAAGTPYFTFKQFSIVVDGAATETAHNYVELPSVDMTNLVEVSAGQFYFMVRSGTSWLLCQYNAGDSFYTTLHTFLADAVPEIPYDWQDFTLTGNGQIDQSLYRKSDGTLLWMRHGTCVVNDVQTNRICVIEVTLTALTILPDVLDLGQWYWGFQTWGTYSDSPEIIVGEVGDDNGNGGNVQGLRWWVDDFATAGAPLAGYPMLRRWFVENPGSDLLIAGHFGPFGDSPNGGLAVVVPEIAGTEVTDWGAAGGRGDVMLLAGGNGIAFEGEAGGSGEVNIVGTTTEVSFDGEAGGLGDVIISPRCELTLEGKAGGRGTATVGDGTVLAFDGMAGGIGDITFPSWYPGVQGYSGAELALHTPTYASPTLWTWGASRPAGYDTRANRAFGARMLSSGSSHPTYDRAPDPSNPLLDDITFWSWCAEDPANQYLLTNAIDGGADGVSGVGFPPGTSGTVSWVDDGLQIGGSGDPGGLTYCYMPFGNIGYQDFTIVLDYTPDASLSDIGASFFASAYPYFSIVAAQQLSDEDPIAVLIGRGMVLREYDVDATNGLLDDEVSRLIVSFDRNADMCFYRNGSLIGQADISNSSTVDLVFSWLSILQSNGGVGIVLHETGLLVGYAATADDVATNPALARRYGLAATPPPWET